MCADRVTHLAGRAWSATTLLVERVRGGVVRASLLRRRIVRERSASNRTGEAGFTLVEVIVALAMLSVGLTVLLGMISSGLGRTGTAERTAAAASLAQSLLA